MTITQVGGIHYGGGYGHWDWVIDLGIGYLPGNATKYIVRHRHKNGRQDLEKALSYVRKMVEVGPERWGVCRRSIGDVVQVMNRLSREQNLTESEIYLCTEIALTNSVLNLGVVIVELERMIHDTPSDTEEAAVRQIVELQRIDGSVDKVIIPESRIDHPAPFGYEGDD